MAPTFGQFTTDLLAWAPSAAAGVTLTPSATPWANSAWVQIIASTATAWIVPVLVIQADDTGTSEQFEIDLGVGASGSEAVVTTVRGAYSLTFYANPGVINLPIALDHIPTGSRVTARMRKGTATTDPWTIAVGFYAKPMTGTLLTSAQRGQCYPSAIAGILITPGADNFAQGAWTTVVASTATMLVLVGIVPLVNALTSLWELDIGIGAAGFEVVTQTVKFDLTQLGAGGGPSIVPLFAPFTGIGAGVRIAARARVNVSTSRVMRLALLYLEAPV